jgi:PadR family transcriptional regulator PadR
MPGNPTWTKLPARRTHDPCGNLAALLVNLLEMSEGCRYCLIVFRYLYSIIMMKLTEIKRIKDRELLSGLIRIHILYHACKEPIFGLGMIEELQRHGYKLSAGTLYPMLHGLETRGLLRSKKIRLGRRSRRVYRGTASGRKTLAKAREKVRLLLGELLE